MSAPSGIPTRHVLSELGFRIRPGEDGLHGTAEIRPELLVPGTSVLRMSVLATWVDTLTGLLTIGVVAPRVPVTLQLDVSLHRPPAALGRIDITGRVVKAGEGVVVSTTELRDGSGALFGHGTGFFMVARDPSVTLPASAEDLVAAMGEERPVLDLPFAERAGVEVDGPGVVRLGLTDERSNASRTLNGGLLALLVEEAALSRRPDATLAAMTLRYLRAVRVGPAIATATPFGDVDEVSVVDSGRDDVLAVLATTRTFPRGGSR